ncbi:MAG TPA: hypothetical protein VK558_03405 [Patescibacteria group bacterium]|nr:hypothetical protein [Patescibacteria group bacterium]
MPAKLLTAERQLGRLVQQLADAPDLAATLEAESTRREAWASLQLDGELVPLDDIAAAQIDLMLLPGPKQDGAMRAIMLIRAGEAMRRGLTEAASDTAALPFDDDLEDLRDLEDEEEQSFLPQAIEDAVAGARAAKADLEAFLAGGMIGHHAEAVPTALPALCPDWLAKAWGLAFGAPSVAELAAIDRAAEQVDSALSAKPGLSGAALALGRLQREGFWPEAEPRHGAFEQLRPHDPEAADRLELLLAERQKSGPGWAFARLIAPWIIGRACQLDGPAPWISDCLLLHRQAAARVGEMREAEHERFLCGALADGYALRRRRLPELRNRLEFWRRACVGEDRPGRGGGRRPGRGGPLALLPLLAAQPLVTPAWVATRLGVSLRAAQQTLAAMVRLGVVREIAGSWQYRLYQAIG